MSKKKDVKQADDKSGEHQGPNEKITVEQVQEQAGEVFKKLPLLGPVSWLYGQSRPHQHYFFNDLNWMIMPALVNDQYKLYLKNDAPISYISWACVSQEIVDRIEKSHQLRLAPHEWTSGEIILIMDVVAPFGGMETLVKNLRDGIFPDKAVHMYVPAMPGQKEGKVVRFPEASADKSSDNKTNSKPSIH